MTNERKIEILRMCISVIEKSGIDGICNTFLVLQANGSILDSEFIEIKIWFKRQGVLIEELGYKYHPFSPYWWNPFEKEPRIKFLNYLINKLKND